MGLLVDSLLEIFKKSLSLKAWAFFFLLMIIGFVFGIIIAVIVLLFLGLFVLLGIGTIAASGLPTLLPLIIAIALVIILPMGIAFQIFIRGIGLAFSRDFLAGKPVSITKALTDGFNRVLARFWAIFGAELLLMLLFLGIIGTIALVLFLPAIIMFIPILQQLPQAISEPAAIVSIAAPLVLWTIIAVLAIVLIVFLLSPLFVLSPQVPLFEDRGIVDSVKRVIGLGKKNYFMNLSFTFLYCLMLVVPIIFFIAIILLPVLGSIGGTAGMDSAKPAFIGIFLILMLFSLVLRVVLQVWFSIIDSFFNVKIYELNTATEKPRKAVGRTR